MAKIYTVAIDDSSNETTREAAEKAKTFVK